VGEALVVTCFPGCNPGKNESQSRCWPASTWIAPKRTHCAEVSRQAGSSTFARPAWHIAGRAGVRACHPWRCGGCHDGTCRTSPGHL